MQGRVLDRTEWPRLVGTELELAIPYLPADTQVIVVEDDRHSIIGAWALVRVLHVEGVWVREDHRKRGAVARQLLRTMTKAARGLGAETVVTGALTDEVRRLIAGLGGARLPGDQYVLPLKKGRAD